VTEPPPESTSLTPEEWDAVRRLRERAGNPATAPAEADAAAAGTAEPLQPVAPPPPPEQTAPPVQPDMTPRVQSDTASPVPSETTAPIAEAPKWGGERRPARTGAPVAVPALAALVVLAVVAAVLAVLLSLRVSHNHDKNQAATAALSAATTGVASVLSYNYKSLDADFTKAEALLTPSFRKSYQATTAKAVQPLAAKYKAVSTAQVSAAGIIVASMSAAKVLVFVSQQVTNTQLSAPRLDRSRIEVELVHTHGQWLINKLTPV
jgi:Mce-associated membrane protein